MGPIILIQLATGLGVLARAALVKSVMDQKTMAGPFSRCPSSDNSNQSFSTFRSLKILKPTTATTVATTTSTSMAWADLSLLFFKIFYDWEIWVCSRIYLCMFNFVPDEKSEMRKVKREKKEKRTNGRTEKEKRKVEEKKLPQVTSMGPTNSVKNIEW